MRNKSVNAKLLWVQFEDVLVPRLELTVKERVVYSHLLRHSLVVGKVRVQFAVMALARTLGLCNGPVRHAVRRLDELGALRVLKRSHKTGHLVEMRLPEKIRALRRYYASQAAVEPPASALEATDFWKTWGCAKPFTIANAALVFIACAALPLAFAASTTLCRACASAAIPTATWFPAVSNATRARATARLRIFCARSTAWGA
jgi:hypothetical protein